MMAISDLFAVSTIQSFVRIPEWDTTNVQGRINTTLTVSTTLECARYCHQHNICDGIFYNKTSGHCATFDIEDGHMIQEYSLGNFFYGKKDCRDSGYEYIWQLDTCITFYTAKLSWSGSQQRCIDDSGNLLVIQSGRKEYFFLPYLWAKYETTGITGWWIGGTDVSQEGIFRWVDGELVIHNNWGYNQPDDMSNTVIPGADCMRYEITSKATWFDIDCSHQFASICENRMFL
ncbi:unnamed protein product [Mytilus edulis]|uniref:C-type lectin domain-containing protein n=1 Tax=Mytilus edulis TaxID=6550 RepID=A0A8S3RVP1_MYTED|nr:unnamed protein product [Mytilus edulis]